MAEFSVIERLKNILDAIATIQEFTTGNDFETYRSNRMLRDAVERNIERLSEASRYIPEFQKDAFPNIDWRGVADIGNVLRHAYTVVNDLQIWLVVVRDLGPLEKAIQAILRDIEDNGSTP